MKSYEAIQEKTRTGGSQGTLEELPTSRFCRLQTGQGNAVVGPERAGPIRIGGDCAGYGAHVTRINWATPFHSICLQTWRIQGDRNGPDWGGF